LQLDSNVFNDVDAQGGAVEAETAAEGLVPVRYVPDGTAERGTEAAERVGGAGDGGAGRTR